MKKIKILTPRFGTGAKWNLGSVLTVGRSISEADAERLLDAGEAEELTPAEPQTATTGKARK